MRRSLKLALPALFPVELHRLMDDEVATLASRLEPVPERPSCSITPFVRFELPSVFIAAERAFGRTSERFDDVKGSFRFPLLLVLRPEEAARCYVGVLRDRRCSIELDLCSLRQTDPRACDWVPSHDELESLRRTIIGFLASCGTPLARATPSFVRSVPAELWIYGCREGDLFALGFDDPEQFSDALQTIERDLADEARAQEAARIDGLLEDVIGGVIRQR